LVSRVAKLCETNGFQAGQTFTVWCNDAKKALDEYKFNEALQSIWVLIADTDKKINEVKPWTLKELELETVLESLVKRIQEIGFNLKPFLPETAEKILAHFSKEKITYPMKGLYNVYNTNAILQLFESLNIVIPKNVGNINKWLADFVPAFGRQEEIIYKNRKVFILLSKNPAGFNQSIQTVSEITNKNKANFLIILNNRIPDGLDISWIWDVDFQPILDVANNIYVSGDRVYDINLRLRYENDVRNIMTFENLSDAIESIVSKTKEGERLYILPTYSAMLEVRKILLGRKLL